MVFQESFDTSVIRHRDIFDTWTGSVRTVIDSVNKGHLALEYESHQQSPLTAIACRLPASDSSPEARRYELTFRPGGLQTSNSLFISYEVSSGLGFCLPRLPSRPAPNTRSGYIVRLIRHGDGANEIKWYRADEGWINELLKDTLPCNPITDIRKLNLVHDRSGWHRLTLEFDTGARPSASVRRTFDLWDPTYPPGRNRGMHVAVKGHLGGEIPSRGHIRLDRWVVEDLEEGLSIEIPPVVDPRLTPSAAGDSASSEELDSAGQAAVDRDNFADAYRFFSRSLSIRKSVRGETHPAVAASYHHLAGIFAQKDPSEAESLYLRALRILEAHHGPDHLSIADASRDLAYHYRMMDDLKRAEPHLRRSLNIRLKMLGKENPDVAADLSGLAELYEAENIMDKAEGMYLRALAIRERALGPDHPQVLASLTRIADFYHKQNVWAQQETHVIRLISLIQKIHGPAHVGMGAAYHDLGMIYFKRGQYEAAETSYAKALAIYEGSYGASHPMVGNILNNLAAMYFYQKKYRSSERTMKRGLKIMEKTYGRDSLVVAEALENLADLYRAMNQPDTARIYLQRVKAIESKNRPPATQPGSAPETRRQTR